MNQQFIWDFQEIKEALNEHIIENYNISTNIKCSSLSIDSRTIKKNNIFVVFKGAQTDGHFFLENSFRKGAVLAIATYIPEKFNKDKYPIIIVDNIISALNSLAKYRRNQLKQSQSQIVLITGSVGKTSTKNILYDLLKNFGTAYKTIGNFNNDLGLPISLSNTPKNTKYAIYEVGMNHLNEIAPLSNLVQPNIAVILNIYDVHKENFSSSEQIADAKCEILSGLKSDGYLILNKDNKFYNYLFNQAQTKYKLQSSQIKSFDYHQDNQKNNADIALLNIIKTDSTNTDSKTNSLTQNDQALFYHKISYITNNQKYSFITSVINKDLIYNFIASILICKLLQLSLKKVNKLLAQISYSEGRGKIYQLKNNMFLIDDSYNANPTSMISGINHLNYLKNSLKNTLNKNTQYRTVAIIGDMLELGKDELQQHIQIANYFNQEQINLIITIGHLSKSIYDTLNNHQKLATHFVNIDEILTQIDQILKPNDIILIKSSNAIKTYVISEYIRKNYMK